MDTGTEGIQTNLLITDREQSRRAMDDNVEIEERNLLEETEKLERERIEKVKTAKEGMGVMTRARTEKQRKENRTEEETYKDARARVSRIVIDVEEKYTGLLSGSKMPTSQDRNIVKTWVQERKGEIEGDLETMNKSFEKMEALTVALAEENEKGRWLLQNTGKNEMEQIWVEWSSSKDLVNQFRELIRVTVEGAGCKSLPEMVQKFKEMRENNEEIKQLWDERKKMEEKDSQKIELQMEELKRNLEEAQTNEAKAKEWAVELAAKLEEADSELMERRKKEVKEGGGGTCPACIRKDEEIDGEKDEKQWTMDYMMSQIKEIRAIQNSAGSSQSTRISPMSTIRSGIHAMDAHPLPTEKPGDYGERNGVGDMAVKMNKRGLGGDRNGGRVKTESDREGTVEEESKGGRGVMIWDEERGSRRDRSSSVESESQEERRNKREKKKYSGQLPRMKAYSGEKESWDTFEEGIRVRYEDWEDRTAVIMIEETLIGEAARVFKNIPKEVKKKGMDSVLRWLRLRLSNETPFEELENEKRLIALKDKVRERKAVEICEEIERLVHLLESDKEKREILKRRHLMLVYERSSQREKLLDCWSLEESFEKMKAKLVQMEYLEEVRASMWNNNNMRGFKYGNGGRTQNKFVDGKPACNHCGIPGHKMVECRKLKGSDVRSGGQNNGGREEKKCTHCQRTGHLVSECYQLQPRNGRPLNPSAKPFAPNFQQSRSQQPTMERPRVQMVTGIEDEMDKMEIDKEDFFVIKKSREVKGEINGMQRTVILDTGAEASLIEEKWLEGMEGVEILPVDEKRLLQDAQQNPIRTTGKVILDVKLEMGRKARIGFHITKSEVGIIIGGKGLDAIGVELREIDGKRRKENRIEEDQWEDTTSATLLKDYCIPSGEMKIVWVKGDPMNTVRLNAESDAVIEGISMGEKMVGIPMMNITEEELILKKDQSIGTWKKLKEEIKEKMSTAKVARVKKEENNEGKENESKDNWWKKMIENHEEGIDDEIMEILRQQKEVFADNEEEIGRFNGYECGIELTDTTPRFVPELVPRVAKEPMEIVAIDLLDLGRGLKGARMQILMKKTNEQVNERLEKERELMKRRYDNQNKNKKVDEPRVGDRVYVRKEIRGELIPKRMVDADDPLHWSWVCGQWLNMPTRAKGDVLHEYIVIRRKLPTEKEPVTPIYKMQTFSSNAVIAKSRFWYFISMLRRLKKANGEILECKESVLLNLRTSFPV
ncbi:hypothetical protein PRIPAC_77971, partial [Pristionchus pacificus]|uniref:Ribosomal protein n=1 Tax=Pristionchus pacificus TaxID=54126 RepID=A0A2A6C354_PRIPA